MHILARVTVVLPEPGLENLRGYGHGILKANGYIEMQSMFLDEDEAKKLIKHTITKKPVISKPVMPRGYIEL